MIPVLYESQATDFTTTGIGLLSDCISCTVTEERNGIYECEFIYPMTGVFFDEIKLGRIVGVTHNENGDIQPFDIYMKSAPIDGRVTFHASHISYRLRNIIVKPFTATSCADAIAQISDQTISTCPFTFGTDKDVTGAFNLTAPKSVRSLLNGEEGSLLDVYGIGEYKFDLFNVYLYLHRGRQAAEEESIRYGINLTNLLQEIDYSETYNIAVPVWKSPESGEVVYLPEYYIIADAASTMIEPWTNEDDIVITNDKNVPIEFQYEINRFAVMDMTEYFDEKPTEEQLRAAATTRLNASNAWLPQENIEVDFVALWQTEEYKDVSALQHLGLCDRVNVYHEQLGVSAENVEIVSVTWNVLAERYDQMQLGQARTNLNDIIKMTVKQVIE